MDKELIRKINSKSPSNQGIFTEPYGIPNKIKEPVIYLRWSPGGISGGSCWKSSNPKPYSSGEDEPEWGYLSWI